MLNASSLRPALKAMVFEILISSEKKMAFSREYLLSKFTSLKFEVADVVISPG